MIVRVITIRAVCDVCWEDSGHDEEKSRPATLSNLYAVVSEHDIKKIKPKLVEVCDEHSHINLANLPEFLAKYGKDPVSMSRPPRAPRASQARTSPSPNGSDAKIKCPVRGCTGYGPFKNEAGLERHKTRIHKTG